MCMRRCRRGARRAVLGLERLQHARRRRRPWPRSRPASTWRPPKRSASVTTPTGSEVQADDAVLRIDAVGHAAARCRRGAVEIEPDQLGRAAADVEHEHEVAAGVDQRGAAGDGEPRLGLARRRSRCRGRASRARGRGTRRRWRRRGRPRWRSGASGAHWRGCAAWRRRPSAPRCVRCHRRLGQPAGRPDALAETDDAREGIDDAEAAARRARHQQAAIVGAEVEGAVRRAVVRSPLRSPVRCDSGAQGRGGPIGRELRVLSEFRRGRQSAEWRRRSPAFPARSRVLTARREPRLPVRHPPPFGAILQRLGRMMPLGNTPVTGQQASVWIRACDKV